MNTSKDLPDFIINAERAIVRLLDVGLFRAQDQASARTLADTLQTLRNHAVVYSPDDDFIGEMTPYALVAWRKAHRFRSQQALADRLGKSRKTIWNYERGLTPIPLDVRYALAAIDAGLPPAS